MTDWYLALALFLLLNVLVGLERVVRGPTPADCMLAAQYLAGGGGVAVGGSRHLVITSVAYTNLF